MTTNNSLILRTTVTPSLKRTVLWRGSIMGILGGLIILVGGFLTKGLLTYWGVPLYLIGIGLIALGLLPQRKLQMLENFPNEIHVSQDLSLTYKSKGKPIFSTTVSGFEKIHYVTKGHEYGLAFWFVQPPVHTIILFNPKFKFDKIHLQSQKKFGCDLFLPYFSKRSHQNLIDFIKTPVKFEL